jgi:hypothetical protein
MRTPFSELRICVQLSGDEVANIPVNLGILHNHFFYPSRTQRFADVRLVSTGDQQVQTGQEPLAHDFYCIQYVGHIEDSRRVRQVRYTSNGTSGSGVEDALSKLSLKGCPCYTNHVNELGLSESRRVDPIAVIAELATHG